MLLLGASISEPPTYLDAVYGSHHTYGTCPLTVKTKNCAYMVYIQTYLTYTCTHIYILICSSEGTCTLARPRLSQRSKYVACVRVCKQHDVHTRVSDAWTTKTFSLTIYIDTQRESLHLLQIDSDRSLLCQTAQSFPKFINVPRHSASY